ncbi:MAG: 1-acyl-sn-glycerol-3-phosphate acyltransferase [Clostridiales bacterium]|nr:1-acyl-sn-glycerol-3-phosphate acyltransferase [Clostridiales bacterium]
MDLSNISADKRALLTRIELAERRGEFDASVEEDLPSKELLPKDADYLCKRISNKIKRRIANRIADKYFLRLIKKGDLIIDGITGEEYLSVLQKGAVITCNHFSPMDNYIVFHCVRKYLPKKYLFKVIREGNYTNFKGLYGFFFRHCNTLPLSSNRRTMVDFMKSVQTLLKSGESILVYPEQEMWWNYRKPRPFKIGAFKMAYRANAPILPTFISMQDDAEKKDTDGYPVQRHVFHVLPPVYPDSALGEKVGAEEMMRKTFALYKAKYEETYGQALTYANEEEREVETASLSG